MAAKKKQATEGPKPVVINIEGYEASDVLNWIAQRVEREVEDRMGYKVAQAIEAAVGKSVQSVADKLTEERIREEVADLLKEGWTPTNGYGEPMGKPITLRERVRSVFDSPSGNYDRETLAQKWIRDAVNGALAKVVAEEVEGARKRLRDAFDDVLKLKFADTMRKMLGVEPK
jgi:hypothetical protein